MQALASTFSVTGFVYKLLNNFGWGASFSTKSIGKLPMYNNSVIIIHTLFSTKNHSSNYIEIAKHPAISMRRKKKKKKDFGGRLILKDTPT